MGVFQLESSGMRDLLKKIRPTEFEDIISVIALFRPGPIGSGMLDEFMKRKHGQTAIKYEHPRMEPVLKATYGVIVYQEQVMRVANELAGFSLAQADLLRRAMGKKIPEVMEAQRKAFVEGCIKNTIPERTATRVFDLIEHFAGYGFNKSHSAAYAMISYRTAYLKAHHPAEYMTALLTSEMGNTDKVVAYLEEARRMELRVLPPDINESQPMMTVVDDRTIRCGLGVIKNVGMAAVESIVAAREIAGRFATMQALCRDADLRLVNRKVCESLIKAGACDSLGASRAALLASLDQAMEEATSAQRDASAGQMTFFDSLQAEPVAVHPATHGATGRGANRLRDWPESQKLAFEKELLGFYVSGHPLTRYEHAIKALATTDSVQVQQAEDGTVVTIGGILSKIKLTTTKKTNEQMAVCLLEDLSGNVEVLVFPNVYPLLAPQLKPSAVVFVEARIAIREDRPRLIAQQIVPVEQGPGKLAASMELRLRAPGLDGTRLDQLKQLLQQFPGELPVFFQVERPHEAPVRMKVEGFRVSPTTELLEALGELVGTDAISFKRLPPKAPPTPNFSAARRRFGGDD